jgi:hypothetical protein
VRPTLWPRFAADSTRRWPARSQMSKMIRFRRTAGQQHQQPIGRPHSPTAPSAGRHAAAPFDCGGRPLAHQSPARHSTRAKSPNIPSGGLGPWRRPSPVSAGAPDRPSNTAPAGSFSHSEVLPATAAVSGCSPRSTSGSGLASRSRVGTLGSRRRARHDGNGVQSGLGQPAADGGGPRPGTDRPPPRWAFPFNQGCAECLRRPDPHFSRSGGGRICATPGLAD